jgi:protease-4
MKGNTLLRSILKGEWLIDIHNIEAYYPILDKIMAGGSFQMNPEPKSILSYVDATGSPLRKNDQGQGVITPGSIAIVKMHGEVIKTGDYCVYGADEIVAALTKADKNPNIAATVFDIDGPGGAVNAIGLFQDFANNVKTKPIIGFCDSALSLHYWTAIEVCDHIMASNNVSARFGSIGVVLSFADNRKAMEEKGYTIHEIYPEESSYKNKSFALAREGDYAAIREEFLSPLAKQFQARVLAKMPNINQNIEGIIKGKTFFADAALEYGLIHSIGGMQKAINEAVMLAEIQESTNNY